MEKVSTLIELIIEFRVKIMGTNSKSTNKCLIISEKRKKGLCYMERLAIGMGHLF